MKEIVKKFLIEVIEAPVNWILDNTGKEIIVIIYYNQKKNTLIIFDDEWKLVDDRNKQLACGNLDSLDMKTIEIFFYGGSDEL